MRLVPTGDKYVYNLIYDKEVVPRLRRGSIIQSEDCTFKSIVT